MERSINSRVLRCLTRSLRLLWRRSSRTRTSRRESTWRSKRRRCETDFSAEDRMLIWSTNASELLAHMKLFLIINIYIYIYIYIYIFSISLHGDDIQDFDTRWDQALLSTKDWPKDSVLESLYKMRIRESVQLQTVLANVFKKSFKIDRDQIIRSWRHRDQIIRTRNFKVRNRKSWNRRVDQDSKKGKMLALKGNQENAINAKQKDNAQRKRLQFPPRWK